MKYLSVVALSLGSVAAIAPAHAATGYVGGSYVRSEAEVGPIEAEADGFEVSGAVAFGGPGSLGVEVDAGFSDVEDADAYGIVGHLYQRGDGHRLGGFVGLADVEDETLFSIGGEGLLHFQDVTLGGAIGYASADDSDVDALGIDGELRYFPMGNLRLDGRLGWANVEAGSADDDAFTFGFGGEYQFAATPVSVFGSWQRTDFDESNIEADSFRLGLRFNWGGDLRTRDREGASLAGLSSVSAVAGGS